jgi:hypothetical protein
MFYSFYCDYESIIPLIVHVEVLSSIKGACPNLNYSSLFRMKKSFLKLSIFLGNFLLRCLWLWIKVRNSTKRSCTGKIDSERQWKFNEEYNQIFSIKKTIFVKLFSDLIYFLLKNPFLTDFLKIIGKQNSYQHIFLDCNFFLIFFYLFI